MCVREKVKNCSKVMCLKMNKFDTHIGWVRFTFQIGDFWGHLEPASQIP